MGTWRRASRWWRPPCSPARWRRSAPARAAHRHIYRYPIAHCASSYGHTHHDYPATDIFVHKGCEFVAPIAGTVDEVSRHDHWHPATNRGAARGGLSVSIIGTDGVRYYGSHLSRIANGIRPGVHVTRGRDPRPDRRYRRRERLSPALRDLVDDPRRDLVGAPRRGVALALPGRLAAAHRQVAGARRAARPRPGRPAGAAMPRLLLTGLALAGEPARRRAVAGARGVPHRQGRDARAGAPDLPRGPRRARHRGGRGSRLGPAGAAPAGHRERTASIVKVEILMALLAQHHAPLLPDRAARRAG